ncbi:hypothetical protein [Thermovibrio sp.]
MASNFSYNPLPKSAGFIQVLLPESYFLSLIEVSRRRYAWEGFFKSKKAEEMFKKGSTVSLGSDFFPRSLKLKVVAITRCLTFTHTENLRETFFKMEKNPCIQEALKLEKGLIVRFTEWIKPKEVFFRFFWDFTRKTEGVCPPASQCSCQCRCGEECTKLGGRYAPVFVNRVQLC